MAYALFIAYVVILLNDRNWAGMMILIGFTILYAVLYYGFGLVQIFGE